MKKTLHSNKQHTEGKAGFARLFVSAAFAATVGVMAAPGFAAASCGAAHAAGPGVSGSLSESAAQDLLQATMADVVHAMRSGDYLPIYRWLSAQARHGEALTAMIAGLDDFAAFVAGQPANMAIVPRLAGLPGWDEADLLCLTAEIAARDRRLLLELGYRRQGDAWRLEIFRPADRSNGYPEAATIPAQPGTAGIPSQATLVDLVQDTLSRIAQAEETGDYQYVYDHLSPLAREGERYQALIEGLADYRHHALVLLAASRASPLFTDPPSLDAQGVLRLRGILPAHPGIAGFRLAYRWHDNSWRLEGVHFDATPHPVDPTLPSRQETAKQVHATLLSLDLGSRTGDYTALYRKLSPQARQPENLRQIARELSHFRQQAIDLSAIAQRPPMLVGQPIQSTQGILHATSVLPYGNRFLRFDFSYRIDGGMWQLESFRFGDKPR